MPAHFDDNIIDLKHQNCPYSISQVSESKVAHYLIRFICAMKSFHEVNCHHKVCEMNKVGEITTFHDYDDAVTV